MDSRFLVKSIALIKTVFTGTVAVVSEALARKEHFFQQGENSKGMNRTAGRGSCFTQACLGTAQAVEIATGEALIFWLPPPSPWEL